MTAGPPDPEPPEPGPRLQPVSGAALASAAVAGLVIGWLLRPAATRLRGSVPTVAWPQVGALFLVAGVIGLVAWHTWRSLHVERTGLESHLAVNRLVLARACALVGALVAGGYAGYAVSWLGTGSEIAGERVLRAAVAALGGLAVLVASVLLERACRVRSEEEQP